VEIECLQAVCRHSTSDGQVSCRKTAFAFLRVDQQSSESDIADDASLKASEASSEAENKTYRPCRAKRNRFQKLVNRLEAQILEDPEGFTMDKVALPPSLLNNQGERQKLIDLMETFQQKTLTSMRASLASANDLACASRYQ